jgi:hypothetical protein
MSEIWTAHVLPAASRRDVGIRQALPLRCPFLPVSMEGGALERSEARELLGLAEPSRRQPLRDGVECRPRGTAVLHAGRFRAGAHSLEGGARFAESRRQDRRA